MSVNVVRTSAAERVRGETRTVVPLLKIRYDHVLAGKAASVPRSAATYPPTTHILVHSRYRAWILAGCRTYRTARVGCWPRGSKKSSARPGSGAQEISAARNRDGEERDHDLRPAVTGLPLRRSRRVRHFAGARTRVFLAGASRGRLEENARRACVGIYGKNFSEKKKKTSRNVEPNCPADVVLSRFTHDPFRAPDRAPDNRNI